MRRRGAETSSRRVLLVLAAVLGCTAPAAAPGRVVVRDAFAFEAPSGGTAAGYAVIVNGTDSADVLDSVSTPSARSATAHGTKQENGLVSMVPLNAPVIAAHDSLLFQPGGSHLMLEDLLGDLKDGERLVLVFWFHRAGRIAVDAMVRPYGS
ncbi:MAG TPA: copper chaperone PCu(A)C [Gemmatimonadales bacterium]|nr:copper chaperone PCu(A)C [Gemmatimonadales bacterium]